MEFDERKAKDGLEADDLDDGDFKEREEFDVDPGDVTVILPDEADLEESPADVVADSFGAVDVTEDMGSGLPAIDSFGQGFDQTGTEEMFVVLPDEEPDVPVVDTEEVTEITPAEDVQLVSSATGDADAEETVLDMELAGEESHEATLEDVTAELDGELLTDETETYGDFDDEEGGEGGEIDDFSEEEGDDAFDAGVGDEEFDGLESSEEIGSRAASGGLKKVLIPLAAAGVLAAGLFLFQPWGGGGVSVAVTGTDPVTTIAPEPPVETATPEGLPEVVSPMDPTVADPGDTDQAAALASRDAFRQKLVVALQLGFGG